MFSLPSSLDALTHTAATHPLWLAGVTVTMMCLWLLRAAPRPMR
jgi:hypothetical protein